MTSIRPARENGPVRSLVARMSALLRGRSPARHSNGFNSLVRRAIDIVNKPPAGPTLVPRIDARKLDASHLSEGKIAFGAQPQSNPIIFRTLESQIEDTIKVINIQLQRIDQMKSAGLPLNREDRSGIEKSARSTAANASTLRITIRNVKKDDLTENDKKALLERIKELEGKLKDLYDQLHPPK